jgi:hypothetical protein
VSANMNQSVPLRESPIAFLVATAALLFGAISPASAQSPSIVVQWNNAILNAIVATATPPTVAARALAVVHTAIYDAWAAYDSKAMGSLASAPARQPASAGTPENKAKAISYAAYRTLLDLFPTQGSALNAVMTSLGYDPSINSTDASTPEGVGGLAASEVLAFRHADGSNQQGDLGSSVPYSDYTGYTPVNFPENLVDVNRWQPLRAPDGTAQKFLSPQWGLVTPFALTSGDQFRPGPQPQAGSWLYDQRMRDVVRLNTELDDRAKVSAEFWNDPPGSLTPPGHWNTFAQDVSLRDNHTLDDDVKMFFVLNNAELDTSIAVWEAKRFYDAIRPVSAVRYWYKGMTIKGWAGAGQGIINVDGANWMSWIPTPAHPEYPSGHSAFSAAAAGILRKFTGSDIYAKTLVFKMGSSAIDPGASPAADTTLTWATFSEVADDAGYSRRAGGIHYDEADYRSRTIGRQVANVVWDRYLQLIGGTR